MFAALRRHPFRFLFIIGLPVLWFVPFTTVATITLALEDTQGKPVERHASADFLDAGGAVITTIKLDDKLPSWANNLHWWSHSRSDQSRLRPRDMLRVTSAMVRAEGCAPQQVPVQLQATYEPTSLAPHGGGLAYRLYDFKQTVKLDCVLP